MRLCIVCLDPVVEFTRGTESRLFHIDPTVRNPPPVSACPDVPNSVASISRADAPAGRGSLFHVKHSVSDTARRCAQCGATIHAATVGAPAVTRTREAVMIACPTGCSAAVGPLMSVSEYETVLAQLLEEVGAVTDGPVPL